VVDQSSSPPGGRTPFGDLVQGSSDATLDDWGWTAKQREAALEGLRCERNLGLAVVHAGISVASLRRRQLADPEFAKDCAAARDDYLDALEAVVKGHALEGYTTKRTTRRPVESNDGLVVVEEVEQEHVDTTLAVSVLGRLRPAVWAKKDGDSTLESLTGRAIKRLVVDMEPDPESESDGD